MHFTILRLVCISEQFLESNRKNLRIHYKDIFRTVRKKNKHKSWAR